MVGREALGAYVGGLGPLLEPMLAVLGRSCALCRRSWGLCWRSWAALGAYVGGLGAYVGGPGRSWALCGRSWDGIRPESGPNPSGKAIWTETRGVSALNPLNAPTHFFFRL